MSHKTFISIPHNARGDRTTREVEHRSYSPGDIIIPSILSPAKTQQAYQITGDPPTIEPYGGKSVDWVTVYFAEPVAMPADDRRYRMNARK